MAVTIVVGGGVRGAKDRIAGIRRRVEIPDRAWKAVGRYMSREVNKQFMTRGANFGTPWKPLATSTLLAKRRAGFSPAPLIRTGQMKRGFLYPAIMQNARGSTATFGSASDIAAYQNYGTMRNGKVHIPARTIMKVTPHMRRDVAQILRRYVIEDET